MKKERQYIIRRLQKSLETVSLEENVDPQELCEWLTEFYKDKKELRDGYRKGNIFRRCAGALKELIWGDFDIAFRKHKDMSPYELEKAYGESHGASELCKQIGPVVTVIGVAFSLYGLFVNIAYTATKSVDIVIEVLDYLPQILVAFFIIVFLLWGQVKRASVTCDVIRMIQKQRASLETEDRSNLNDKGNQV